MLRVADWIWVARLLQSKWNSRYRRFCGNRRSDEAETCYRWGCHRWRWWILHFVQSWPLSKLLMSWWWWSRCTHRHNFMTIKAVGRASPEKIFRSTICWCVRNDADEADGAWIIYINSYVKGTVCDGGGIVFLVSSSSLTSALYYWWESVKSSSSSSDVKCKNSRNHMLVRTTASQLAQILLFFFCITKDSSPFLRSLKCQIWKRRREKKINS